MQDLYWAVPGHEENMQRASHWMYQSGDFWMATLDEDLSMWWDHAIPMDAIRPDAKRPIEDVPKTGTLLYVNEDGELITEDAQNRPVMLASDLLHVILDSLTCAHQGATAGTYAPWTHYDSNAQDPKTTVRGYTDLMDRARVAVTAMLESNVPLPGTEHYDPTPA